MTISFDSVTDHDGNTCESATVAMSWAGFRDGATWAGTISKGADKAIRPLLRNVQLAAFPGKTAADDAYGFTGTDSYQLHHWSTVGDAGRPFAHVRDDLGEYVTDGRTAQVDVDILLGTVKALAVHKFGDAHVLTVTVDGDTVTVDAGDGVTVTMPNADKLGVFPRWTTLAGKADEATDAHSVALNPVFVARIDKSLTPAWRKSYKSVQFAPITTDLEPVRYGVRHVDGVGHGLLMPVRVS